MKNLYTILFVVIGVAVIFGAGFYASLVAKDLNIPWVVNFHLIKPENNGQVPGDKKTALATDRKAVLSFLPLSGKQKVGDNLNVQVVLDSQDQAAYGADIFINYDPTILDLVPIAEMEPEDCVDESDCAELGTRVIKDWQEGKIVFSYLAPAQVVWHNEIRITELSFKIKRAGQADLKFLFEKDSTSDCNVAGENGQDILGQVYDAHFNIID